MSDEELQRILKLISQAYESSGRNIQVATLYTDKGEELVIDNRQPEDIQ